MALESVNPATGRLIRRYREYSPRQVESALTTVQQAFTAWRELSFRDRARHIVALGRGLRTNREAIAALMTAEMGKPIAQSRSEIEKCAGCCDYYARHAAALLKPGRPIQAPAPASVVFEPLGVILLVMPWNFPLWQAFRAAVPALMAGNTVVLKHASNVSGCALEIERLFADAGAPAGIFRTLLVGSAAIPDLIADTRIRGVSLTGSTAAGRKVGAAAGAALKPCVLELGGSDPYVVLADADLDHAAEVCATARLINSGQSCVAAKRFIVVESARAAFTGRFVARLAAHTPSDPTSDACTLGPLARPDLRAELHRQVTRSVRAGAKLLLGGKIPSGPGAFYPPTALADVKPGMPAFDEELFGPVAPIIAARDESHALALANQSPYGLGAALFTRRRAHGRALAIERLEAGMVFVNDFVRSDAALPFGGVKDSGIGRELSAPGIRAFVNTKTLWST